MEPELTPLPPAVPEPSPGTPTGPTTGAPPARTPDETAAWILALIPLIGIVLGYLVDQISNSAGNSLNISILVVTFFVMRQDKRQMVAAGYGPAPSLWWVVLPAVYLWKRANILGRSKAPFWTLIAVYVVALGMSAVVLASAFGVLGTPAALGCREVDGDVVRLWNSIDGVKRANLVGERLTAIEEVSNGDSVLDGQRRTCRAVVLTKDGGRHDIDFVISNENGTAYVRVTTR